VPGRPRCGAAVLLAVGQQLEPIAVDQGDAEPFTRVIALAALAFTIAEPQPEPHADAGDDPRRPHAAV
jgi:hypothetical protein